MSGASIGALRHRVTLEAPVDTPDRRRLMARSFAPLAHDLGEDRAARPHKAHFVAERQEQAITSVASRSAGATM